MVRVDGAGEVTLRRVPAAFGIASHVVRLRRFLPRPPGEAGNSPESRAKQRYQRAGLTAVVALGARGLTMLMSLLTVPLTLNYLGPERYGMWMTISSIIALLSFTDLGVGNGLINAVTRAIARSDLADARRQVSSAFMILMLVAAGVGILFVLTYPVVSWARVFAVSSTLAVSEAGPGMAAWVACFLLGLPLSVAAQVRLGRQEGYFVHMLSVGGNLVAVAALLIVILTRQGLPALVFAMAGPPLLAMGLNWVLLFGRHAAALRPSLRLVSLRTGWALLRAGFLFFVLQIAIAVAFTSDSLVAAQVIGPVAVAEYAVVSKLFMIPTLIVATILSPLWPAYGDAIARGDLLWARSTLVRSLRGGLAVTVPLSVFLVTFGMPIIRLWVGPTVTPPLLLLLGFGIWVVMSAVGTSVAMLLNGAHEIGVQAAAAVVMALANITLSIWLASRIGVAGVMWGTVITYGVFTLLPMAFYVPRVLRRIELRHALGMMQRQEIAHE